VLDNMSSVIANGFICSYRDGARKIRTLSENLSDDQFWMKPYPYGNSFGHLTLHLIGNLNFFIGAQIGNTGYLRDREREFTEGSPPSKELTLRQLEETVDLVVATIEAQTLETWTEGYQAPGNADFVKDRFSLFLRCATHFHHHVGQMIYLEKELSR
jgi:hypothetical protein